MPSPNVLILATSLDADSRSRTVARRAKELIDAKGIPCTFADLRDYDLPFCGTDACHENADAKRLRALLEPATHILLAVPVYNYDVNAAAKNVVELLGDAFEGKTVAFICAAGGHRSYMSVMPFANSLMLDFRCWVVPRFVYVTGADVADGRITNPDIEKRTQALVEEMFRR
jgi:NAD(P)H-dependent FMN reductase